MLSSLTEGLCIPEDAEALPGQRYSCSQPYSLDKGLDGCWEDTGQYAVSGIDIPSHLSTACCNGLESQWFPFVTSGRSLDVDSTPVSSSCWRVKQRQNDGPLQTCVHVPEMGVLSEHCHSDHVCSKTWTQSGTEYPSSCNSSNTAHRTSRHVSDVPLPDSVSVDKSSHSMPPRDFDFTELLKTDNIPGLSSSGETESRFQKWFSVSNSGMNDGCSMPPSHHFYNSTSAPVRKQADMFPNMSDMSALDDHHKFVSSTVNSEASWPQSQYQSVYEAAGREAGMEFLTNHRLSLGTEDTGSALSQDMIDLIALRNLVGLTSDDQLREQSRFHRGVDGSPDRFPFWNEEVASNGWNEHLSSWLPSAAFHQSDQQHLLNPLSSLDIDIATAALLNLNCGENMPSEPLSCAPERLLAPFPVTSSSLPQPAAHHPRSVSRIPPRLTLQPPLSPPYISASCINVEPPLTPAQLGVPSLQLDSGFGLCSVPRKTTCSSLHPFLNLPPSLSTSPLPSTPRSWPVPPSPNRLSPHLSLPQSPAVGTNFSNFSFQTLPVPSFIHPHLALLPTPPASPLSPRMSSNLPPSSPLLSSKSQPTSLPIRRGSQASLLSPSSPRHALGVPLPSSSRTSPCFFGTSMVPNSRSHSPSPIMFGSQPPSSLSAPLPVHIGAGAIRQISPVLSPRTPSPNTLHVSPSGSGAVSPVMRVPSPQELSSLAQSILQSALIKRQLEEQKERYLRRQQERMRPATSPAVSNASRTNVGSVADVQPTKSGLSAGKESFVASDAAFLQHAHAVNDVRGLRSQPISLPQVGENFSHSSCKERIMAVLSSDDSSLPSQICSQLAGSSPLSKWFSVDVLSKQLPSMPVSRTLSPGCDSSTAVTVGELELCRNWHQHDTTDDHDVIGE